MRVAHAPGIPGTFSPPPRVSDPDMHHGTCVTHVPWCMSGSLTSGFLWSRCRGKRSRHSRRMRNPQFYVSGKRPMGHATLTTIIETIIQLLSHRYTVTRISCLSHNDVMTWKCFPHYVGHRRTHPQRVWVIQIIDIDCNVHYLYHFPYMNYWYIPHLTFTNDGQDFRNSTPLPSGNALKSYTVCQYPTSAATRDRELNTNIKNSVARYSIDFSCSLGSYVEVILPSNI